MSDHTFQSRIKLLAHKCRKAVRLYASMGRRHGSDGAHSEQQIAIWREVNTELLDSLIAILEKNNRDAIVNDVYLLHDRFYQTWRRYQAELHTKQNSLVSSAENGDFNKCAILSQDLVLLKARVQANEAAHHELKKLIEKSNPRRPVTASEDTHIDEEDSPLLQQAKVIPLRRRTN